MSDRRDKYAISAWLLGRRFCMVRPMRHETALAIGRHLWRLRYLGFRHVQVEQGSFPTSAIRTLGEPVTRAPDVWSFPFTGGTAKYAPGEQSLLFMRGATMSPRVERQLKHGGEGPNGSLLMEGSSTNYALYSEGKP